MLARLPASGRSPQQAHGRPQLFVRQVRCRPEAQRVAAGVRRNAFVAEPAAQRLRTGAAERHKPSDALDR